MTSAARRLSFHHLELMPAWGRLLAAGGPALLAGALATGAWPARLTLAWDVFAAINLLLMWLVIATADAGHIRRIVRREDPSRVLLFGFVILAACAAMLAVVMLLSSLHGGPAQRHAHVGLAAGGVLAAWLLLHTVFTLRYAHLYYDPTTSQGEGGLVFPGAGEPNPDYLDFAYFSFVVGMTAQTADIGVTSRLLRRLTLLHGLLAFGFNTAVVALTISGVGAML